MTDAVEARSGDHSPLRVEQLSVRLPRGADRPYAIKNLNLTLVANEILCLVGESGSGKSVASNAIMRLLPPGVVVDQGRIEFAGQDLLTLDDAEMRRVRGAQIGMIFQEPMTALNPLHTIGAQIGEMFRIHTELDRDTIRKRSLALLAEVHLPDPQSALLAYPHELSGGQRQRAMIAIALALEPKVLIADEPTTALDVTTQAQILALIRDLQRRKGTSVLFITHDFGVVAEIADRVAVMNQGELVEVGPASDVLFNPQHAYTRKLIGAVPSLTPPSRKAAASTSAVLRVEEISKTYRTGGFFGRGVRRTLALDRVSLELSKGSTLGIVGESGSGKSTLARCLVKLIDPDGGRIELDGSDIVQMRRGRRKALSRRIQMVFQDPYASLNPRRRAGELVAQGPMAHGMGRREALRRASELFHLVGLDPSAMNRFPHEFSGGQRQRIGLARALALEPEVLVADEPVSALDVSVQAQVLDLLSELKSRLGLSMLFVTHDLRVAAQICDHVVVMQNGRVVETGPAEQVFTEPQAEYTRALLDSIPGRAWKGIASNSSLAAGVATSAQPIGNLIKEK